MALLVIGIIAALLVALSLGFALLVELRALRRVLTHASTTRHRIFKIESARHRESEVARGTRAGVRADHEERILTHARTMVARLDSIRASLASLAAAERVAVPQLARIESDVGEDEEATRLTSRLPDAPGATAAYVKIAAEACAPLAHPDLIGSEDLTDEAGSLRLGPEDKTPPRRGRAAVLVRAFRGPEQGGAA